MVTVDHEFSPKLTPPRRRSDTIRRDRLHGVLSDALEYEVVVVSAPAGYGKSTLAIDWSDDAGVPVAWLSLDRQDIDPLVFISDLVGAVRVAFPDALEDVHQRLVGGAKPSDASTLIGQFVASAHRDIDDLFLMVIDDVQVLEGADDALAALDTLVRGLPLSMRLYILSRTMPRLSSLPRMSAQRRALSLGGTDLEFTDDEAVEFLRRSGIDGASSQLDVVQRAGGWAAALAILADHYDPSRAQGGTAPGSEFVLSDFIDHEVLARLPEPHVTLLSACAVLDSFDAEFAESLTGDPQAEQHLRELEGTSHLITSLSERWLKMHALLREHLLDRLAREDPERLLQPRRSAAAQCARRGQRREAIDLSILTEDWAEVVRELHDSREEFYQRGEWTTLGGWLDRLPVDVLRAEPDLAMTRARLSTKMLNGQQGLAQLDSIDEQQLSVDQRARRDLYRAVSLRQVSRLTESLLACRRARQLASEELPDDDPLFAEIDFEEGIALGQSGQFAAACERLRSAAEGFDTAGDHHRAAEAHDNLGNSLFHQGWLTDSMVEYTAALRRWRMLEEDGTQLTTMNNIANVQHMLGELETARDTFNGAIERAREIGHQRMDAYGQEGLAAVERDLGDIDTAEALYTIALQRAQELDDPVLVGYATCGLALAHRDRGQHAQARTLLDHGLRTAEQHDALHSQAVFRTGIGATLISERRHADAIPVLEQAVAACAETGAKREHAIALLLLSCACFHRRKRKQAVEHLKAVHEIVEELGYDQFLYSEARLMPEVVEYGAARRIGSGYFRSLRAELRPLIEEGDSTPSAGEPQAAIRAEAFGGPRVTVRGHQVADLEWRSERSKEMFFYLLHHGKPLRKEQIANDLWPDLDPKRLNSAFHSTLYRLRKAIDPQVVMQTDDGYQVNPTFEIAYDATEFDGYTQGSDSAPAESEIWAEQLVAAVALYRGPFAETFDSDWANDARRRYEDRFLSCLLSLASHFERSGDTEQVVRLGDAVSNIDPVNEEAALYVMRAQARAGHLDLATRAYRRLQNAMLDDLGEEPSEQLQKLYARVISGAALDT